MPHDAGLPDPSSHVPQPYPREAAPIAGRIEPPRPPAPATPGAPAALASTPDVLSLLSALRRRWISAVLLGGTLAALAAIAMWHLLAPKNTAFAKILVSYQKGSVLGDGPGGNVNDFKTVLQTTAGRIMSRPVIMAALKRDEVKRLNLDARETDPVQTIEDELRVEFKDNSELLNILFSHTDAQVATTVANAIKEAFLTDFVDAERSQRAREVSNLEKLYGEKVDTLKTKKANLQKVAQNLGTTDPNLWREQRLELGTALRDAKQHLGQVRFKKIEAQSQLETINARIRGVRSRTAPGAVPDPKAPKLEDFIEEALDADGEAKELRARVKRHEEDVKEYERLKFRHDFPKFRVAREKLLEAATQYAERRAVVTAKAKRAFASRPVTPVSGPVVNEEEMLVIRAQLQKQVDALGTLEETLAADIKRLSLESNKTPTLAAEYDQLADEIKRDETILAEIGAKVERKKVELEAASRIARFQDAEMMRKDNKKQLLATAVAPLAVLLAVCIGLAYVEFRQRRVRNAGEISRGLGIQVVGAVPRMPHLERHLVSPVGESDLEGTPVMESIDAIRTRLLHEADARAARLVMVTSATAGEGKTTLASALATSLARAGRKTLLLDGDLRRPTVHELFEVPMQPGFSEVLLGEIEVAEAAQETMQENLSILPAGQWDREVLLALSRGGLEGVFEKLAEEFDFILIDSHPVLAATDSLLIGRQVDAVILSILREVSQMPRVYAAQQQMMALGIHVLGAVVNGTNPEEVFTAPAPTVAAAA